MRRTTIFIDEQVELELKAAARRARRPVAGLVREAIVEYLRARRPPDGPPAFVGAGRSGRSDVAERHEELLWREPRPREVRAPRRARRAKDR